ncbi:MAG: M28 family peptidase [Sedimentibacter saalensis]|uniref:M20/M25/M40 family metallo-hydrolase n=1 Tax=Sedimentibacter saalensis TaxID=130788 RepID=UPI002B2147D6|nr:M20/M25/M40 family metallo-hydrolase [Sedimentibacter saalensis]MEA5095072.1 M28 family peptidase [Sedimentibacter saalensis]
MVKKSCRILSMILVFMMVFSMSSFAAVNTNASTAFDQKVLARIDSRKALEHIKYLSETIGPRVAGTAEERQAANYISKQFEKLGYDVEVQTFKINNVVSELTVDILKDKLFMVNTATGSGYTDLDGITGKLVDCGLGAAATDFPADVKGKIAFVQRGSVSFAIKAQNAVEAGAIGVLMYNNASGNVNPTLGEYKSTIPYISISLEDGQVILQAMKNSDVTVTIKSELMTESQNVIATRKPLKANTGIVYITAHYDSVPHAPGANDNASGTAMLIEFARILKSYPTDKEIRFIACGAEEIGLDGSYYYVEHLSKNELDNSIANFNMDMIATSHGPCNILYADTTNGQPNLVTESAVASGMRLGNNILEVGKGSSSDHRYFGEIGIPAACFIWGDEDGNLEPWYHKPEDTIKINISLDRLQQAGEMIGAALYDVIRTDTRNLEKSAIRRDGIEEKINSFGISE